MKRVAGLLSLAAGTVIFSFLGSTTQAGTAHGSGGGHAEGRNAGGFSGGSRAGVHCAPSCGSSSAARCGSYGAYYTGGRYGYGYGNGCYGRNSYGNYGYASALYYGASFDDSNLSADTSSAPVSYSSEPVADQSPQPVVYIISSPSQHADGSPYTLPTVIRGTTVEPNASQSQSSAGPQYSPQKQLVGVAEVKALVKAGLSEELIINQVHAAGVVYHLTGAEIIDLKEHGVTDTIINAMIKTAPAGSGAKDARFTLTGIVGEAKDGYLAVVNGQTVAEHSYVDGAIVTRIERDQVALDLNGHEVVATLY